MPKSRCGAITSSTSEVSGSRARCASPSEDRLVRRLRISRQRSLCERSSVTSSLVSRIAAERPFHLLGDQRDGGERRAELVRGRRRQPVERRQMLLALQHQFGGGQRIGEQPRLFGDAEGIDGGEGDDGDDRHPHAGDIDERHGELALRDTRAAADGRTPASVAMAITSAPSSRGQRERQRGRRDDDGHGHQQRERIGQPAGHVEQAGKLQRVEDQDAERRKRRQPVRRRIAEGQQQVQPGRAGDQREAQADRQREIRASRRRSTTVTLWPTMASQRSRISVLRRSRWLCPRSGVSQDLP